MKDSKPQRHQENHQHTYTHINSDIYSNWGNRRQRENLERS